MEHPAEHGLVVEDVETGFCGAVVDCDKHGVMLEDRCGRSRVFRLGPGFHLNGRPVSLIRPRPSTPVRPARTASGSIPVTGQRARVARGSRILVEGKHDAELIEKVWGDDLRVAGVVMEELGGVNELPIIVRAFGPGPSRRLGILVDHLVHGSKEARMTSEVATGPAAPHVLVLGHPYVDVWQAVRPAVLGIESWPRVPKGAPWKEGVLAAFGLAGRCPGRVAAHSRLGPKLRRPRAQPARQGRRAHRLRDRALTHPAVLGTTVKP